MTQLDLFAELPQRGRGDDPIAEFLCDAGFAANQYLLEANRTLGDWGQAPDTPSRLFKFPVEFMAGDRRRDGRSAVLLNHPLIGDHPLVLRLAHCLGRPVPWEPTDEFGRDRGATWRYFHAIDLLGAGLPDLLLETRQFTDPTAVSSGVSYALRYRAKLTTARARDVMLAFGHTEPADRSAAALDAGVISPDPMWCNESGKVTKTPRFGMNEGIVATRKLGKEAVTWAILHGLEDGWFTHTRSGYLTMTPKGIDRLKVDMSRPD
jgi:hypothetical protein